MELFSAYVQNNFEEQFEVFYSEYLDKIDGIFLLMSNLQISVNLHGYV